MKILKHFISFFISKIIEIYLGFMILINNNSNEHVYYFKILVIVFFNSTLHQISSELIKINIITIKVSGC